jgi:hypothetical protein
MCLNGKAHAIYCLTCKSTYVSLYTCLEYSVTTLDTILTWICDKLLTQTNILLSRQPPLNISISSLVLCWRNLFVC